MNQKKRAIAAALAAVMLTAACSQFADVQEKNLELANNIHARPGFELLDTREVKATLRLYFVGDTKTSIPERVVWSDEAQFGPSESNSQVLYPETEVLMAVGSTHNYKYDCGLRLFRAKSGVDPGSYSLVLSDKQESLLFEGKIWLYRLAITCGPGE